MPIPDAYDMWEANESRKEAWLNRQPICSHCRKRIQDERLWDIEGELYHKECAEELYERNSENYEN